MKIMYKAEFARGMNNFGLDCMCGCMFRSCRGQNFNTHINILTYFKHIK